MEPFLGQIMQVGFPFAPSGWATCAGQTLPISQNAALFSLLGTNFGGNGVSTFQLPDLQGRVAIGTGTSGTGAGTYTQGEVGGNQQVSLGNSQLPVHTHVAQFNPTGGGGGSPVSVTVSAVQASGNSTSPSSGALLADTGSTAASPKIYAPAGAQGTQVPLGGVSVSGGGGGITGGTVTVATAGLGQPFSILPPFVAVQNIIALQGVFPSRG